MNETNNEMNTQEKPFATHYRVSTITCNASLNTKVALDMFYDNVEITEDKFLWSECGEKQRGMRPCKKKRAVGKTAAAKGKIALKEAVAATEADDEPKEPELITRDELRELQDTSDTASIGSGNTTEKKTKGFDNQVTVVCKMGEGYYPNCKIFKNGNIHLTGIRSEADGNKMVKTLADEVCRIFKSGIAIVESAEAVNPSNFKIRMINCDFGFPCKIRRKSLHILLTEKYHTMCSFQPLTYPGVKLQYYWNESQPVKDGICPCKKTCYGKGDGDAEGKCKKVTVAIFDSGKTLITGANSFVQVDAAYKFICDVVQHNLDGVQKVLPLVDNKK